MTSSPPWGDSFNVYIWMPLGRPTQSYPTEASVLALSGNSTTASPEHDNPTHHYT